MKPRIGIVVPIGRYSPMLKDALNSIMFQDVRVEVAVYDASNDPRTKDLLETFSSNLTYVHYGPDGGQANAIFMGWAQLDTEIVGWLNDDDFLGPGALKKVIEFIDGNPSCSGIFGPSVIVDDKGVFSGMHPAVDPKRIDEIYSNNVISQPSCFIKHAHVKKVGGINKDLHFTMDWDLWARLLSEFPNSFVFCEDVITAVTFSNQTKTAKISLKRMLEIYTLTRRYNSLYKSLVTVMAFFKWGISQRIHGEQKDKFFKSPRNRYMYWSYSKSILGLNLKGPLSRKNIEDLEIQNEMKLKSSKGHSHKFIFNTCYDPGSLVRVSLNDIECHSIDFQVL